MTYSTPRTWATGDSVTAAMLNQEIRDNIGFQANPPSCRAYHNANQSIPNGALTTLALNSEVWDTDTMHSTVTANSRLTIKTAGLYIVSAWVIIAANATGVRAVSLLINGTEIFADNRNATTAFDHRSTFSVQAKLAVNDYVEMAVYQTSGGALNALTIGNYAPSLAATWVGLG